MQENNKLFVCFFHKNIFFYSKSYRNRFKKKIKHILIISNTVVHFVSSPFMLVFPKNFSKM